MLKPSTIVEYLNEYVVGQEDAKNALAYAFSMHVYRKMYSAKHPESAPFKRPNVLLMGPTGSGKTYMLEKLCKAFNLPFTSIEALNVSLPGWEGKSMEKHLTDSFDRHRGHIESVRDFEEGILFIDEVDKICMPLVGRGGTDHNKMTQMSLLKQIEGTEVNIGGRNTVDTSRMLIVLAGNFQDIRKDRRTHEKSIGFAPAAKLEQKVYHEELIKTGMIPEFAGRISIVSELKELTDSDLERALKISGGALEQYQTLLKNIDYDLTIDEEDTKFIIERCKRSKIGARGLQAGLDIVVERKLRGQSLCLTETENTTSSSISGDSSEPHS